MSVKDHFERRPGKSGISMILLVANIPYSCTIPRVEMVSDRKFITKQNIFWKKKYSNILEIRTEIMK